jgi:hypothetical protein
MDDGPENTNEIESYIHCAVCVAEYMEGGPEVRGKSPAEYATLEVGTTKRGFQIWCRRHDCNVMHVDFEGHRHKANTSRRMN